MTLCSFFVLIVIGTWHFEQIPEAVEYIVLDVDTAGMASVAYQKDSVVYYARRVAMGDSFGWTTEVVDSNTAGLYGYRNSVELAMDMKLSPHIIYFKHRIGFFTRDLYYTTKDSLNEWNSILLDTVTGYKSDIDTDTLNCPHIVYDSDNLWHQYWDGSNWIKEYINDSFFSGYVSLVIDRNNNLHIGVGPPLVDAGQRLFHYGFRDSSGWYLESIGGFDIRWPVGIAADNNCDPHLSFNTYGGESYHVMKQDTTWISDDISSLGFFSTAIAIDDLVPHLLGADHTFSYTRHIWKPDTVWWFEDIHLGYPRDLAIDKDGYLHCVIVDSLDIIYGTTRPQFVCEQGNSVLNSPQIITISRLPLKISLSGSNLVKEIKIVDISGRFVKKLPIPKNASELMWNGLDQYNKKVRTGVYFLMIVQKEKMVVQKVLIIN